jgi:hypothetical protein
MIVELHVLASFRKYHKILLILDKKGECHENTIHQFQSPDWGPEQNRTNA